MSVAEQITELERAVTSKLENPDAVQETVSYRFDLSDEFTLELSSEARNDGAAPADTWFEHPLLTTKLFISHRGPLSQRRQCNAMAFSCLYDHRPEKRIYGLQYDAPSELPIPISVEDLISGPHIDIKRHLGMIGLTDTERALYSAALAMARFVDNYSQNDIKYTKPPIDNEAATNCNDEDEDLYGAWCDAHDFEFTIDVDEIDVVKNFLRSANMLLAQGAIFKHESISRIVPLTSATNPTVPVREILIEANSHTGPEQHIDFRLSDEPKMRISIIENGIEHVYERTKKDTVEVRLHNGEFIEKYKGLKSFEPVYEEDGTIIAFTHSEEEFLEFEAQERAIGMFEPTVEKINFFLERISNLR